MKVAAMRVLATAASNNIPFQQAVLQQEAGTVQWLLQARPAQLPLLPVPPQLRVAALTRIRCAVITLRADMRTQRCTCRSSDLAHFLIYNGKAGQIQCVKVQQRT